MMATRQEAPLHLVIPVLLPAILPFGFPIKKSHIYNYLRPAHGDIVFCSSYSASQVLQ